jgi:probable HAF family extracellular repeat protein
MWSCFACSTLVAFASLALVGSTARAAPLFEAVDLTPLAARSGATAVSATGQVVGWSESAQGVGHAFSWTAEGGPIDLALWAAEAGPTT